jgi:hypothetical protein
VSTSSGSTPSTLEWRESAAAQNSEIWGKRTGDQKAEVVQNSEKISEFSQLSFRKERVSDWIVFEEKECGIVFGVDFPSCEP